MSHLYECENYVKLKTQVTRRVRGFRDIEQDMSGLLVTEFTDWSFNGVTKNHVSYITKG